MYDNIVIIPYRHREAHLEYFIKHTVPLIHKYLPNTKVVVVEQNDGKLFNRGAVLNVVFKEYQNKTKYFFTHDVDINPTEKCIKEYYVKEVSDSNILGIYTSQWDTLGGIIKITSNDIYKINGFPNNFWGWGAEDTALRVRAEYYNLITKKFITRSSKELDNDYFKSFDDVNDRQTQNNWRNHLLYTSHFPKLSDTEKQKLIMSSGLNNIEYTILERKMIHDIVELIKVDI